MKAYMICFYTFIFLEYKLQFTQIYRPLNRIFILILGQFVAKKPKEKKIDNKRKRKENKVIQFYFLFNSKKMFVHIWKAKENIFPSNFTFYG